MDYKVKVDGPEMSEGVQEYFFKQGYTWGQLGKVVFTPGDGRELGYIYARTHKNGDREVKYLSWDSADVAGKMSFDSRNCEELYVKTSYLVSRVVEVNGKKYLAEDVEEALKNLKEIA